MGTFVRSRRMLSSAARSVIDTLETRQLLSVTPVYLTNGEDPTSSDFFQVELVGGGSTRNTALGADQTDTIYDYFSYLDTGDGHVYNLNDYAQNPQFQTISTATDQVTLNLANGGTITITVNSEVPRGSKSLINSYQLSATGYDLRNAKLYQYMDSDVGTVSGNVLSVSGSTTTGDLVLTTVDPASSKRQAQSPGGLMVGGYLSGWGADKWHDLRDAILAGGYDPAATGTVDIASLPYSYQNGLGWAWGPGDITTALAFKFTALSHATISTVLGVRDMQMKRPIIILPDFMGSMPTQSTWGSFLTEFASGQGHDPADLTADPMVSAYEPLMRLLDDTLGYDRNIDLFFGAYDWRRPIAQTDGVADGQLHLNGINFTDNNYQYGVEYLRYWMEQAKNRWASLHGGTADGFSVDIIGHGMGGLLARAFIQSDYFQANYAGEVNRVISLGAPNEGMVNAYLWLEPGIGIDQVAQQSGSMANQADLVNVAELQLLWRMARDVNGAGLSVGSAIPSLYNLTPTFNFVSSTKGGTIPSQDPYRNTLLLDLNADASSFVGRTTGGVLLAGSNGISTPCAVIYGEGGAGVQFSTSGDGLVLWSSASFADGRPAGANVPTPFTARHIALFSATSIQPVIVQSYLSIATSGALTPVCHPWLESATSFTFGYVHAADFILTDSDGQRLGYTSSTGYLNEMANAYYSGSGAYGLFLVPAVEQVGTMNLALQGLGSNYTSSLQRLQVGGLTSQNNSGYLDSGATQQVAVEPALPFGTIMGKPVKQVITEADGDRVTFELTGGGSAQLSGTLQQKYQILLSGTTSSSTLKISVVPGAGGDGFAEIDTIAGAGLIKAITAPAAYISGSLVLNSSMSLVPATASLSMTLAGLYNGDVNTNGLPIKSMTMLHWQGGGQLQAPSIGTLTIKGRKDNPKTPASEALAGDCSGSIVLHGNASAVLLKTLKVAGRIYGDITANGAIGKITAGSFSGQITGRYVQGVTMTSTITSSSGAITGTGCDATGVSIGSVSLAANLNSGRIVGNGRIKSISVVGRANNSRIQSTGNIDSLSVGYLLSTDVLVGVAASYAGRFANSSAYYPASAALLKSFTVRGASFKTGEHPDYIADSNISAANIGSMSLKDTDDLGGLAVYFLDGHKGSPKQITYANPNVPSDKISWHDGQAIPVVPAANHLIPVW